MVLGDFNLPFLGLVSEVAQVFMTIMAAMGLSQIISGLIQDSRHMPNTIFISEQWQHELVCVWNLLVSPLSCSDHTLVSLRFPGPIWVVYPQRLMNLNGLGASLHSPAKALIKSWNQRASEALNRIAPVWPLLTIHTHSTLWFTEELWVLKRVKRPR